MVDTLWLLLSSFSVYNVMLLLNAESAEIGKWRLYFCFRKRLKTCLFSRSFIL